MKSFHSYCQGLKASLSGVQAMLSLAIRWSLNRWTVAAWTLPENWAAHLVPWM